MIEESVKNSLAGCVVLYNPRKAVVKNIESYLLYLETLYVIDNSNNSDEELVQSLLSLGSKIVYISQQKNEGVASALNRGACLALNANYKWLLTMDQDSRFFDKSFFDGWRTVPYNETIGLIAASYTANYDRWQRSYSPTYNEIHFVVTSGNILNLEAWSAVKGFENKLFIDEVDHDYCLKLRVNGYKILITKEIVMVHTIGEIFEDTTAAVSGRKLVLHRPLRYYYMSRNVLYVCKKYVFVDLRFVASRLFYLLKNLIKIMLFYPHKLLYLRYFFLGFRDFLLSRYGAYQKGQSMINK
jgi:rhamnosyltransferase